MSDLFNLEAETAYLSCIFNNPPRVYEINGVKPFMFSSKPNELLFATIEEISDKSLLPDVHLIETYLTEKGKFQSVGGIDYLNYIKQFSVEDRNFKEYQDSVIRNYKTRSLISVTSKIASSLTNSAEVDSTIEYLRVTLDKLTESSGGDSTASLSSLVKDSWDEIYERYINPGLRGYTSGLKDVDMLLSGVNVGEPIVVGARPGMGKTAFICNTILKSAKTGVRSLVFSQEMNKQSLIERMIALDTDIPLTPNIRMGQMTPKELDQVSASLATLKDLPIYIDSNFGMSLDYFEYTVRKYKKLYDINVIYVDYLQLMSERGDEATHELGRITRKIKLLSNELSLGAVILSQLNRACELRDDKRPLLSDFRQSGNIEEDFDVAVALYRDEVYNKNTDQKNKLEFIVRKNRSGPIGTLVFGFKPETMDIHDL